MPRLENHGHSRDLRSRVHRARMTLAVISDLLGVRSHDRLVRGTIRRAPGRRRLAQVLGAFCGACIGAISVCYLRDNEAAVSGAMRGLGLGVLDGVVLVLLFFVGLSVLHS
jgi:hypothetical protein